MLILIVLFWAKKEYCKNKSLGFGLFKFARERWKHIIPFSKIFYYHKKVLRKIFGTIKKFKIFP